MIPSSCPVAAQTGPTSLGSLAPITRSVSFLSSSMMLSQFSSSSSCASAAPVTTKVSAVTTAAVFSIARMRMGDSNGPVPLV